jgi:Mn-dependent DtxR family transcriptional regulator
MLNINPDVLNPKEMSLLEQEFHELPKPKFESELQDDLHEILLFMNNSNQKISFKDISKKFSITKTTTRKRVNRLIESGLAVVKKNGRNKIIRATELGKSIL